MCPVAEIQKEMRVTVAALRWTSNNTGKFKDQRNKLRVMTDINHGYKILGHINLVPEACRLMIAALLCPRFKFSLCQTSFLLIYVQRKHAVMASRRGNLTVERDLYAVIPFLEQDTAIDVHGQ